MIKVFSKIEKLCLRCDSLLIVLKSGLRISLGGLDWPQNPKNTFFLVIGSGDDCQIMVFRPFSLRFIVDI